MPPRGKPSVFPSPLIHLEQCVTSLSGVSIIAKKPRSGPFWEREQVPPLCSFYQLVQADILHPCLPFPCSLTCSRCGCHTYIQPAAPSGCIPRQHAGPKPSARNVYVSFARHSQFCAWRLAIRFHRVLLLVSLGLDLPLPPTFLFTTY
jgi:hypothetical protein